MKPAKQLDRLIVSFDELDDVYFNTHANPTGFAWEYRTLAEEALELAARLIDNQRLATHTLKHGPN